MLGTYEYSDFPMDTETYGVQLGEHIPAHVIHRYLTNYAEKFGFFSKIQFETKVESAEHIESGGWLLTVSRATRGRATFDKSQIFASKLIVATGLTSEPSIAKFSGSDSFGVPLFHSRDFLNYAESLDTSERVCIFGGTKSAWDAVYTYASKGIKVDWVIRESGHGPTWSKYNISHGGKKTEHLDTIPPSFFISF
jgi:cation diffusion facilitator CzcD-associated flavoprotein CzcO